MDAMRRVKMTLAISFLLVCWMTSFGTSLVQDWPCGSKYFHYCLFWTRVTVYNAKYEDRDQCSTGHVISKRRKQVGCESDSECFYGYSCCTGTIWCCPSGYLCTGSATCLSIGVIIGPVVAVVIIIILVALWCYRRRRAASYNQI